MAPLFVEANELGRCETSGTVITGLTYLHCVGIRNLSLGCRPLPIYTPHPQPYYHPTATLLPPYALRHCFRRSGTVLDCYRVQY